VTTGGAVTAKADIESYTVSSGGANNVTVNASKTSVNITGAAANVTTVTVGGNTVNGTYALGNAADVIVATTGANIAGVNTGAATTAENLTLTGAITMTQAQHQALSIAAAGGGDTVTLTTTGLITASSAVESYVLADGGGNTFNGTNSAVTVTGGNGADAITTGNVGDRIVNTADGAVDVISTGSGNDTIVGADNTDVIGGGDGLGDRLELSASYTPASDSNLEGIEVIALMANDLTLNLANQVGEAFTVTTGNGSNTVTLADGWDSVTGGTGVDVINAGSGNDTITGGGGVDNLTGGNGEDVFVVAALADIDGLAEVIAGGAENDTLRFDASGAANLSSANITGVETFTLNVGGNTLTVSAANLADVATLTGGAGPDQLTLSGADTALSLVGKTVTGSLAVQLGAGGDNLTVSAANLAAGAVTTITGGAGADTLTLGAAGAFSLANTAVTAVETIVFNAGGNVLTADAADLANVTTLTGDVGTDVLVMAVAGAFNLSGKTLTSIEEIRGTGGDDAITGTANGDTITGGAGADNLTGGLGADTFVLVEAGLIANAAVVAVFGDTIADFEDGNAVVTQDILQISAASLGNLTGFVANPAGVTGLAGAQGANFLVAGAGAQMADQAYAQFLFNTTSGELSIDADGTHAGAAVVIGTIGAGATLTAVDFLFVV
jgi:Ca2+-binding RTX toxin-like protein